MNYERLHYVHKGILNRESFAQQVDLRCYSPSKDLAPFVELYFVARWNRPNQSNYVAMDILTKPVVNVFFTAEGAYINGITKGTRTFIAGEEGMYAGVKFRVGGFRPFCNASLANIADNSLSVIEIFEQADTDFITHLVSLTSDNEVLQTMEELLRSKSPSYSPKIDLASRIVSYIEKSSHSVTPTELTKEFHMSERSLQYLFSEYVGAGIKWTNMRFRLLEALQKPFETTRPNWTEIAAELNYSTQSHFINDFRRIFDISPSQYVKLILDQTP